MRRLKQAAKATASKVGSVSKKVASKVKSGVGASAKEEALRASVAARARGGAGGGGSASACVARPRPSSLPARAKRDPNAVLESLDVRYYDPQFDALEHELAELPGEVSNREIHVKVSAEADQGGGGGRARRAGGASFIRAPCCACCLRGAGLRGRLARALYGDSRAAALHSAIDRAGRDAIRAGTRNSLCWWPWDRSRGVGWAPSRAHACAHMVPAPSACVAPSLMTVYVC